MAKKAKNQVGTKPSIGFAGYILLAYWWLFAIIYISIDLFIDLYTDVDYGSVFWCTAVIALPFTIITLYLGQELLFTKWYTYLIFPTIIYSLYLGSAYFTALKLDLLTSAADKPVTEEVLPVYNIRKVFARKAGFIRTDVTLGHQNRSLTFEGTRTSYFLLKTYKTVHVKIGRSYLGSYYITYINIPAHERWDARIEYFKDWFYRYYWLLIVLPTLFAFGWFKDKYFPAIQSNTQVAEKPYCKFFKCLFIILITLFGLFMLLLLLVGVFGT